MSRFDSGDPQYHDVFASTARADPDTKSDIRELAARVDKLELINEALWRLIEENTTLTEEDLIEKITEIDLIDGRYDGKKDSAKSFRECPKCHRRVNKRHQKCFYCGETFLPDPFG